LKYLYKVKDRDTKLLAQLEKGTMKQEVVAETIALIARDFKGVNYLKLSNSDLLDKNALIQKEIIANLQECLRQISQFETLKQNSNIISESTNSNDTTALDLQQKQQEREEQIMQKAMRMGEALNPNLNYSIDAKEFLSGNINYLPEPYLIVRDSPVATFQNVMGITFNNLAAVINILARKHNYRIISTACDNHTMYVFMEKMGSLR
jgi:type I site-specific restriction-modification system R (restriction) subunit